MAFFKYSTVAFWALAALLLLWLTVSGTPLVGAPTITPTRFDDPTPDGCLPGDCSLREAIIAANEAPGPDTMDLAAGAYVLGIHGRDEDAAATGDLDITDDLTITGADPDATIITPGVERDFDIMPSVAVNMSALTVRDLFSGFPPRECGGGLHNSGTLTLTNVIVTNNLKRGDGAGICNEGTLTLLDSAISNNWAALMGAGGGIFNRGTATLANVTVSGNTWNTISGGGIFNIGSLTITDSTVSGNVANDDAGNNLGGGVYNSGIATLTNVTISGNTTIGRPTGSAIGGPYVGAGFYNGDYYGAGTTAQATLTNVTISGNSTDTEGGGIFNAAEGSLTLKNTIVAGNTAQKGGDNCAGETAITSAGYNLSSDDSCAFTGPGDLTNTDPLLSPLRYNGGPTQTHALLPGSPAIDAGDNTDCPATDQRGVARPLDGNGDGTPVCDIGAYEFGSSPPGWSAAALTGWNNLAWLGANGADVEAALGALQVPAGGSVQALWLFNAATQTWSRNLYFPDATSSIEITTVNRGEAFWILVG